MNRVLLAGANGMIGSFLNNKLHTLYSTTGIDYSENSCVKDYCSVDLSDPVGVRNFVNNSEKYNALIFLVGLAHKKGKGQEIDEFRSINKQTVVNLVSTLNAKNKLPNKIIFASTISVYGEKINQSSYQEYSDTNPFSPYAVTKLEAEKYLLKNFPTQSWILRFAPVYSQDFQLNINRRTKAVGWYYKVGGGTRKLSLCNLENISEVVKGILKEKVPPGIYNISDGNKYSYNDLLDYVNAKWVIPIPTYLVKSLYYFGELINSIFLKENTTKLISDNIYPSDKIRKYVVLKASLNE